MDRTASLRLAPGNSAEQDRLDDKLGYVENPMPGLRLSQRATPEFSEDDKIPDNIEPVLWNKIQNPDVKRAIAVFCNRYQAPFGISDQSLWEHMPKEMQEELLRVEGNVRHRSTYKNQVCKFFCDWQADDFDFDAGVNSIAIINGLVLTIPYGVLAGLTPETLEKMKVILSACPHNQSYDSRLFMLSGNASLAIYCSISGLFLVAFWFLFKGKIKLDGWSLKKQRVHILLMTICTFVAVIGVLCLFSNMINFLNIADSDLCDPGAIGRKDAVMNVGVLFCLAMASAGTYLMA